MKYLILFLTLSISILCQAQTVTSNINSKNAEAKKKKWNNRLDVNFTTNSQVVGSDDKTYNSQIWYFLSYKINENYTARLWLDIAKDLSESYEEKLNNTRLSLMHKGYQISERLKFIPSASLVLPTSEMSKRNEEMNLGIELNPAFAFKVNDKLSLSYLPRLAKNFHEYKVSRTNNINTEYKLLQFLSANYSLTDSIYTSASLIYANTWSYYGTRRDPSYVTFWELGYSINKQMTVAMGTLTGGSIFDRQKGPDENIKIYDEHATNFYGNFVFRF